MNVAGWIVFKGEWLVMREVNLNTSLCEVVQIFGENNSNVSRRWDTRRVCVRLCILVDLEVKDVVM